MLKDVAHADVAKDDDIVDDTDPNYDDYYEVSTNVFLLNSAVINVCFRMIKMTFPRRKKMRTHKTVNHDLLRLTRKWMMKI